MYLELAAVDAFQREVGVVADADWNDTPIEKQLIESTGLSLIEKSKRLTSSVKAGCVHARFAHLLLEELGELLSAPSEVDALDALADLLYALLGVAATYDWPMSEAFAEVHRSNMSKIRQDGDEQGNRIREKGDDYVAPQIEFVLQSHRDDEARTKQQSVRHEMANMHQAFIRQRDTDT